VIYGAVLASVSVPLSFVVGSALEAIIPKHLWGASSANDLVAMPLGQALALGAVLGPAVETVLAQSLPLEATRAIGMSIAIRVITATVVWALFHFAAGGLMQCASTLLLGSILAIGYVSARPHGLLPPFLAATTAHGLHNAAMLIGTVLFPSLAQ